VARDAPTASHRMVFLKMVFEPVERPASGGSNHGLIRRVPAPGRLPRRDILLGAVEIQWHPKHAIDFAAGSCLVRQTLCWWRHGLLP